MDALITFRGRAIEKETIEQIQGTCDRLWVRGRSAISRALCRQWGWRQPNGQLKDSVCRGLLLKLERAGHIRLQRRQRR